MKLNTIMPKLLNEKELAGAREFFTNLQRQFASAATLLADDTLKPAFEDVQAKLKAVLDGLPAKVEASGFDLTEKLDWLFDSLTANGKLCQALTEQLTQARQSRTQASAEALSAAIAERTQSGELVPKGTVEQLCSAARTAGIAEGRQALQGEFDARAQAETLAQERAGALTKAGLPLPEDPGVLRLAEADFAAARTQAETRAKALTEAGLEVGELLKEVWAPEAQYQVFHRTVAGIKALRRSGPGAEPFAAPPAGAAAAPTKRMLG